MDDLRGYPPLCAAGAAVINQQRKHHTTVARAR
jgi:hypothetical protein